MPGYCIAIVPAVRSALRSGPVTPRENVVLESNRSRLLVDPVPLQFELRAIGRRWQQRNPAAEQNRDHREAHFVNQARGEETSEQLPAAEDRDVLPRLLPQISNDALGVVAERHR